MILLSIFSFIQTWFTQGFLHPVLTPSHIILIIGLALLTGQAGAIIKDSLILAFAVIIGMVANHYVSLPGDFELILLIGALIVGFIVILKLKNSQLLSYLLVAVGGLLLGYDSSPVVIPGLGSNSIYNWLGGAVTSIIGLALLVAIMASLLNKFWEGVLVRVIGSWIVASALLTLTFKLVETFA